MPPPETPQQGAHCENCCSKPRQIHWFEWIVFLFVVATAIATACAAKFTYGQWTTAEDQEKRSLRAYVGVTPTGIENFGDATNQRLTFIRKNYGTTPAYNLFSPPPIVDVIRFGAPLGNVAIIRRPDGLKDLSTLFPTMEFPSYARGAALSRQQFDLARNGSEYVIVYYGIVYYDDAFNMPHYTRWCWMFRGEHMTGNDADYCLGHNDSD